MNYKRQKIEKKRTKQFGIKTDFLDLVHEQKDGNEKEQEMLSKSQVRNALMDLSQNNSFYAVFQIADYLRRNTNFVLEEMSPDVFFAYLNYLQDTRTQRAVILSFCYITQIFEQEKQELLAHTRFYEWINLLINKSDEQEIIIYAIFVAMYSIEKSLTLREAVFENGIIDTMSSLQCPTKEVYESKCKFFLASSKQDFGQYQVSFQNHAIPFFISICHEELPYAKHCGLKGLLQLFSKTYSIYEIFFQQSLLSVISEGLRSNHKKLRRTCANFLYQISQVPDFPFEEFDKFDIISDVLSCFRWDDTKVIINLMQMLRVWTMNGQEYVHDLILRMISNDFWNIFNSCSFGIKVLLIPLLREFAMKSTEEDANEFFNETIIEMMSECVFSGVEVASDVAYTMNCLITKINTDDFTQMVTGIFEQNGALNTLEEIAKENGENEVGETVTTFLDLVSEPQENT